MKTAPVEILEIAGLRFSPVTVEQTVGLFEAAWQTRETTTFLYQNMHTLHLQLKTEPLVDAYSGTVALIDGYPMLNLLRLARNDVADDRRVAAIDLLDPVMTAAVAGARRCFVIGQESSVLERALVTLRSRYFGLEIDGHHGFFDHRDADHVIEMANDFDADLVLVGMGSPTSELWIAENRDRLNAPVVWCCGALMEYVAGTVPTAPRWAGPMRLEWFFRLISNPRRFLYRYSVEPLIVAWRLPTRVLRRKWRGR